MSIVNSENFACSHAEPTMSISCRLNVMCGDRSHGGVVSGDNLEPEPLNISWWSQAILKRRQCGPVLSQKNWECDAINGVSVWGSGECVEVGSERVDWCDTQWIWRLGWGNLLKCEVGLWFDWSTDWHVCASDALIGEMELT